MSDYLPAADWYSVTRCETSSPGFTTKIGPALSDSFLQPRGLSSEARPHLLGPCPWLEDRSCHSLTSVCSPPPPSPAFYGHLAPTSPHDFLLCSGPEWSCFHGDPFTPPCSSAGDWMSRDRCSPEQRVCVSCGSSDAPLWRRDAAGQHLCYTCSRKQEVGGNEPLLRPRRRAVRVPSARKGTRCSDCGTENTTLWRRSAAGRPVCNACGLYYRLHQVTRPLHLKKEKLQTRNRKVTNKKATKRRSDQPGSPAWPRPPGCTGTIC